MNFTEYVAGNQRPLLRMATALTADPGLAEDIVQDVLARAYRRWPSISELDQPHAYVRRMVVNEYLSWRRRWARITPRANIESPATVPDHAEQHAERAALMDHIARLSPRQRAVLALRFYEGLRDDEVAQILGCSAATVRSHVSRGLAELRVQLGAPLAALATAREESR